MYSEYKIESVRNYVRRAKSFLNAIEEPAENLTIKLSFENSKTGRLVPSVSLLPVLDCTNCKNCARGCYDMRHDMQNSVLKTRANNSKIYRESRRWYWDQVMAESSAFRFFRINVGGDIDGADLVYIWKMAKFNAGTKYLIFTKSYSAVSDYITRYGQPENLNIMFSAWYGENIDNPHNLPVFYPVFPEKYAAKYPDYKVPETAISCGGNCTNCAINCCGCFGAKRGDTIKVIAH